ncbi:MAG: BTAD domain-containing putative transcriptional regulator [Fimbriimonadaceae bacterium]
MAGSGLGEGAAFAADGGQLDTICSEWPGLGCGPVRSVGEGHARSAGRRLTTDTIDFAVHIQAASNGEKSQIELAAALDLYHGPLLPGFGDEWILPQSLELEELYAQAACMYIESAARSGDLNGAITAGRKAIAICPAREDLHIALMKALGRAGQTSAAVKQFEELERMLDDQWGEAPGPEALAVLEALPRSGQDASVAVVPESAPRSGLSLDKSSFFGREHEISELSSLLGAMAKGSQLVTLVGLGGTGKTRLAQRFAQELLGDYLGRVWFVSLVGAETPAQFNEALLTSLVESPTKGTDAIEAAASVIGQQPALLVLDNLEQMAGAAGVEISKLTRVCGGLRVLATSRVPLEAEGERIMPLSPLPLPDDYHNLAALRNSPCVQLLVEAAQAVRPGFGLSPANAQSVLLLCRRLEGIPLAIELAAAKLATLSPAQVIASIGRRVDLATARADYPQRHRSLETIIEWSVDLLDEDERSAFSRLSICRGGFNIELATELIGDQVEARLQKLNRCSLLGWSEDQKEVRFEMLETVREMAWQLLEQDPKNHREAAKRHFAYIHGLCARFASLTSEREHGQWVDRLALETGNVLAALETGARGWVQPQDAWELALQLHHYIRRRGRSHIWIEPLEILLSATVERLSPAMAAQAHSLLAESHYGLRAIRNTYDHCVKAIEASDRSGDPLAQIEARGELATPAITLGRFKEARQALEEAIGLLSGVDDDKAASRCHLNLAWVTFDGGDEESSEELFVRALDFAERSGDAATIGSAVTGLACAVGHSRYEESQVFFDRAVAIWVNAAMPGFLAHCLYNRSMIDYRHGKLDSAVANISRAFRTYVTNDIALGQTILSVCGNLMSARDCPVEAAKCWGRAEAARNRYSMSMIPTIKRDYDRELAKVRATLTPAEFNDAIEQAQQLNDRALAELLFGPIGVPPTVMNPG